MDPELLVSATLKLLVEKPRVEPPVDREAAVFSAARSWEMVPSGAPRKTGKAVPRFHPVCSKHLYMPFMLAITVLNIIGNAYFQQS